MFSDEQRCSYQRHPLVDVICQLRFPDILTINTKVPADFQESIRGIFPNYSTTMEAGAPQLVGVPGSLKLNEPAPTVNYQFSTADGIWRVNLTSKFISLACSRYPGWEGFAKMLDGPLSQFIKLYQPAYFQRIGLRYINIISRKELGLSDEPFRQLMNPQYLGILSDESVSETAVKHAAVDTQIVISGGCHAKIHAGPGVVKRNGVADPEVKFIFDQDLFMSGNIPVNYSAGALQTLHSQAYPIFRGAITDTLHEAMEPTII